MAANWKRDIPKKDEPIYDFYINDEGRIMRQEHAYYSIMKGKKEGSLIRKIRSPYGIISKTDAQMDRFLNGHLFTMDPDKARAEKIVRQYYADRLHKARIEAEICTKAIAGLNAPEAPVFTA